MNRKNVQVVVSRFLLLAFLGAPFLMFGPINEADAYLRHTGECKEVWYAKGTAGTSGANVEAGFKIECEVEYHWNPFSHDSDSSSSGSCDSTGPDWCDFCLEEHWVCNFGSGW